MWQPGSRAVRSGGGGGDGFARLLLVLLRWVALLTFLAFVTFTCTTSSSHILSKGRELSEEVPVGEQRHDPWQLWMQHQQEEHHGRQSASSPLMRERDLGGSYQVGDDAGAEGGRILGRLKGLWHELEGGEGIRMLPTTRSLLEVEIPEAAKPGSGKGVRLELVHRDSPGSPIRKHFATRAEEISETLARDLAMLTGMGQGHANRGRDLGEVGGKKAGAGGKKVSGSTNLKSQLISGAAFGTGNYLVDFRLGTPPQRVSLIVDTGGDLVWTQCAPCVDCYQQRSPLYRPSNSSSFKPEPCNSQQCNEVPAPDTFPACLDAAPGPCFYRYQYGGGASFTTGILGRETVTFKAVRGPEVKLRDVTFGCGNGVNAGAAFGQADGVLGLGQGPVSLPQQIRGQFGAKFAYCLLAFSEPTSTSSLLVLGEESEALLAGKKLGGLRFSYTDILRNEFSPTFYYVRPVKAAVGGAVLPIKSKLWMFDSQGNGGTVVQSGVTLTYLVPAAYRRLYKAVAAAVSYPRAPPFDDTLTLCFRVGKLGKRVGLPRLTLWFKGGAVLEPPVENIFVEVEAGVRCLAIGEVQDPAGPNVLGNLLQQNYLVVYDPDKSKIGFAPSDCSSL